jgi:hypothetical protein
MPSLQSDDDPFIQRLDAAVQRIQREQNRLDRRVKEKWASLHPFEKAGYIACGGPAILVGSLWVNIAVDMTWEAWLATVVTAVTVTVAAGFRMNFLIDDYEKYLDAKDRANGKS